jgi:mannose-6-phosphate isomerase-like protein (cupin superfamily)
MSIPVKTTPPDSTAAYIIDQLEGERITIPGSKGVFRILASSKQTSGGIAVFTSGAVLSDAPGFHWHAEAHDVFLVTKGFLKLWNGDKCRIMGPGDFAYIPPVSREPCTRKPNIF